jgi:hypothetical protein
MAIGVFGLQVAYKLKRLEVMSTDDTHGWFGGGTMNPGYLSTVDRIDFSNDTGTASVRGSLSQARDSLTATGNSNYGWFGGGEIPGSVNVSTVDRIDFSNDSSTASVRGPLTSAKYSVAATGNSNYGWFGGGFTVAVISTVDRIDFSNDSGTVSVRGPLSLSRGSVATGNSNYGWFGGGTTFPGPIVSTVDRIDFSNDATTASPRGPLSLERSSLAATGNSNYGWFGGGFSPSTPISIYYSTIDRIDFSNDSRTANIRGPLSAARQNLEATGNSNYGWFGGALFPSSSSRVDRIDFSNDSVSASVRGPLSSVKADTGATSGQAKGPAIKLQKAGNYGWFGGGQGGSPVVALATVDRIDFSNDLTTASIRGPLSSARLALTATGNSNYGWFAGGSSFVTRVDRIDFSNDAPTASIRGSLSSPGRQISAAAGNSNYGWFGGGGAPGPSFASIVERINFSNDSTTTSLRGDLSFTLRSGLAATGNSNYGWFGGGYGSALVERLNFSNDSAPVSVRGPLSLARHFLAATGNSNYGWFGGGKGPGFPGTHYATVDRINFSNDSITASVRGPLSSTRSQLAATGNSDYGWFGGGYISGIPGTFFSTVNRINFSNDLATIAIRNPLSSSPGVSFLAATSNSTR